MPRKNVYCCRLPITERGVGTCEAGGGDRSRVAVGDSWSERVERHCRVRQSRGLAGDRHVVLEELSRALGERVRDRWPRKRNSGCERALQAAAQAAGSHARPVASFGVVADAAVDARLVGGHAGEARESLHVVHLVSLALAPLCSAVLEPNLKTFVIKLFN